MIAFDILTGELKYIQSGSNVPENEFIEFGDRNTGDIALDAGDRLHEGSIIDLKFRV
jgi:hypothetical protein